MKKLILTLAIATCIFTSCSKDTPQSKNSNPMPTNTPTVELEISNFAQQVCQYNYLVYQTMNTTFVSSNIDAMIKINEQTLLSVLQPDNWIKSSHEINDKYSFDDIYQFVLPSDNKKYSGEMLIVNKYNETYYIRFKGEYYDISNEIFENIKNLYLEKTENLADTKEIVAKNMVTEILNNMQTVNENEAKTDIPTQNKLTEILNSASLQLMQGPELGFDATPYSININDTDYMQILSDKHIIIYLGENKYFINIDTQSGQELQSEIINILGN